MPARNSAYAWTVVIALTLAYMCSYVDRQIINLMVEPIKRDMHLTDTKMSVLQGTAFVIAYLLLTPILGRRVDVGNRKNIVAVAILVWSASSALSGLANSVTWLFVARAGVGAAEAALAPAAFSLIADYFTRDRIPRAIGLFTLGPYLGGGFALIAGGLLIDWSAQLSQSLQVLSQLKPWQLTFILVGMMGIPIGLSMFALREPPRRAANGVVADDRQFSTADTLSFLWLRRAFYLRFFATMTFTVAIFYSMPAWIPAILVRNYGVSMRDVGLTYGIIVLIMGTLGVLAGPLLEQYIRNRGVDGSGVICIAIVSAALVPTCAALLVVKSAAGVMVIGAVATFLYSIPQPIAASALQLVTPNRMRGVTSAVYVILVSAVGLGIAPTMVALVTDYVFVDERAVSKSLGLICSTCAIIATWIAIGTRRPFARAILAEETAAIDKLGSTAQPGS
jgi:MFS family permease